jgi:phospholipase C
MKHFAIAIALSLFVAHYAAATPLKGKLFDRAIFVVFENANYQDALDQAFFTGLTQTGAGFTNFSAEAHPSQGNYIALTSGSLNGVYGDGTYDLEVANLADLLDAKGISWKVYAEGYPGNCYTGAAEGTYVRKHNPFISYGSIQHDTARCAKIVNATQFDLDLASGQLPEYVFYVPDLNNDGHDTDAAFAADWYAQKFGPLISDATFMNNTLLVSTFDESGGYFDKNQIYTSLVGPMVRAGASTADPLDHYSLLRMVEENWSLGSLGQSDATAAPITGIWQ